MGNMKGFGVRGLALGIILSLLAPLVLQAQISPAVKPYSIESDLANIANLSDFGKAIKYYTRSEFSFSGAQKEKLIQNEFVVAPSDAEQFFHIYESSPFGTEPRIPNFITSDCALQLYHLFYDFTLRAVEVEELLPAIQKLTQGMLEGSEKQCEGISDPELKAACQKNISFFAVAAKLLKMEETSLPETCVPEIENELQKIEKHEGRDSSTIFPFEHDYSQYIVRGHYTRSEELQKFFLAMMWYGQSPFPFEFQGKRAEQQILQALLITDILFNSEVENEPLIRLWDKIYSITTLYVGSTDDLNAHHFRELTEEVYGKNAAPEDFSNKWKLDLFFERAKKLPQPRIVAQAVGIPSGLQFRFMGQRFIPDSYMMQKLIQWPDRPWPKGLDVMAVLGSTEAADLLDTLYEEPKKWNDYLPQREKLVGEFANLPEDEWYKSLFSGWLYVLKALLEEKGKGYPSFMQNKAWTDKELNAALASWAELRHDVILYGKPSMAEGGDGEREVLQPKGYVEPVPEFYSRLLKLVRLNRRILLDKGFLSEGVRNTFDRYENLLSFLRSVAERELAGIALGEAEYKRIRHFGEEIESISISLVELGGNAFYHRAWYEVLGPDRDIACIADVHTSGDDCLEEAVGHINTIYVVVPIEGKLHLTRGGVFSYYEFQYPAAHRLTDEAWQEMLKRDRAPELPSWTSSYMAN